MLVNHERRTPAASASVPATLNRMGLFAMATQSTKEECKMYTRIMVLLDGSRTAECSLQEAIRLATEEHATLCLLHVVDGVPIMLGSPPSAHFQPLLSDMRKFGEDTLKAANKLAAEAGIQTETLLCEGTHTRIAQVIIDEAKNCGCDVIVMSVHGRRGFNHLVIGSVADLVVQTSPVPVMLLRQQTCP